MLTPEYLAKCSQGAEQIAAQLHTNILKQVIRRIQIRQARGDAYLLTATDKWQLQSLMDAGYLRNDIEQEIAQATNLQRRELWRAMQDAGVKATKYDDKILNAAGIPTTDVSRSPYFTRLMQREYEATLGTWNNATRTTADAAQQTFINTMDSVHNEIMLGSSSYTEAYTRAINHLASEGLSIVYPSGHVDTIEVAALRCVRTGIAQASAEIGLARMEEYGVDLVLVSSHMGARPSHAVWQGKVYSRSGHSRKYPDFRSSTGYGTGAGLCGWNCRHNFSPYFEGMVNPFEQYDSEENRALYEKEQKQREMERAIRKSKREVDVLSDAVNHAQDGESSEALTNMRERAKRRLKAQNKAYRDYCSANDLRPLRERLKIGYAGLDNMDNVTPVIVSPDVPQEPTAFEKRFTEYASKLSATMDKTDVELFEKRLDSSESNIKKLYVKYADALNNVTNKKGAGCYWQYSKNMEYSLDEATKRTDRGRYATLAHEMGHHFDYTLGDAPGLTFKEFDTILQYSHLPHRPSMSDQFLLAARQDRAILKDLLKEIQQGGMLDFLNDSNSAGVQDALDGFFNSRGKGFVFWGHGAKYYNRYYRHYIEPYFSAETKAKEFFTDYGIMKKSGSVRTELRTYDTASEMWANIASAVTEGGYQLEYVEKYMPNTLKAFRDIISKV
jgi:hypothetical protein